MSHPDAVQLLVFDQGLHGRVVEGLDLPAPGRPDPDAGLREGLDHVGGKVGADPAPEGGRDLVGQLGQPPGLAPARVPVAEQVVQDRAVHFRAPRQPGPVHLGGHQHPRRLGRRQQPHPRRVFGQLVPPLLVGVDGEQVFERQPDGGVLRLEQRGLCAGRGGALRRVGGYGATAQPGQRGGRRAGLSGAPFVTQEEGLGVLDVVAPLYAHPRGEQTWVHLGRGAPDPPGDVGPVAHGPRQVRLPQHRAGGQPAGTEGGEFHATVLGRSECPPVGHAVSVAGGSDNAPDRWSCPWPGLLLLPLTAGPASGRCSCP